PEHLIPRATPVLSHRLQAPAPHHRSDLNHAVAHRSSGQSAVITGFPLSAISRKPSPGKLSPDPNPHRQPSPHRFPAGSFFGGFRTPAPLISGRSLTLGRHPKPFPIAVTHSISSGTQT